MKKILMSIILLSSCVFAKEELEFKARTNENKEIVITVQKKQDEIQNIKNVTNNIEIYEVKQGDTLLEISKNFKVPVKDIMLVNDIKNPASIKIGKKLIIPR